MPASKSEKREREREKVKRNMSVFGSGFFSSSIFIFFDSITGNYPKKREFSLYRYLLAILTSEEVSDMAYNESYEELSAFGMYVNG